MPYAVNIRSEHASAASIRSLWDRCASLEQAPSMQSLQYPPHLTLAVYDDIAPDALIDAFDAALGDLPPLTIRFERLGYFDAPHAVILWAEPLLPGELLDFHQRIHQALGAESCRPNYRPGTWMPHCSLAISIDRSRREEAIALAGTSIEAFEVTFDVADCAFFHPVEVLHEKYLRAVA